MSEHTVKTKWRKKRLCDDGVVVSGYHPNRFEHRSDGSTVIFLEHRDGAVSECLIDTADYPLVEGYRWSPSRDGNTCYVWSSQLKKQIHTFLMPGCEQVDHKDRNGLDNRRENLRPATKSQNAANQRKKSNGITSQFRGVSWDKNRHKFKAEIQANHKQIYLGRFASETEAAFAFNEAARLHCGEFAYLNQIAAQEN
jgi:HNH endonuclease